MKFEPTRNSTRVVFFVIYLTFLLLYEGFEAALFSTLTVKETSITTLQTVYDDPNYKIGSIQGTATEYLLEVTLLTLLIF